MTQGAILYYVHDPMCSWCWGFQKVWPDVKAAVQDSIDIQYLAGGLAADSNENMPKNMQQAIAGYWRNIQQRIPGTEFNFDFWEKCQPRRSTYPSCRAVISAKIIDADKESTMIDAIQQAYYLKAKNPSDNATLIDCAAEIGLDRNQFEIQLSSKETNEQFIQEMTLASNLGAQGFPSLIIKTAEKIDNVPIDYNSAEFIINKIQKSI